MRKVHIKDKLEEIDFSLEEILLGDFDQIGEVCAKKAREPSSELYQSVGCFFRPNYERGILLYALVSKFKITSFLEVGFGRGYSTFCVAKAMSDMGIDGKIVTIDPNFNQEFISELTKFFPQEWFSKISFANGTSEQVIPELKEQFDLVYIDGDHTYEGTKKDWEATKDIYSKFLLFDDYLPASNNSREIQCSQLIDEIDDDSKELIIMDRRIFFDDRRIPDDEIDYGQVLLTNKNFKVDSYLSDW